MPRPHGRRRPHHPAGRGNLHRTRQGRRQDRSDAVKAIQDELLKELAPGNSDPNASYASILAIKDKQKQIKAMFGEATNAPG